MFALCVCVCVTEPLKKSQSLLSHVLPDFSLLYVLNDPCPHYALKQHPAETGNASHS